MDKEAKNRMPWDADSYGVITGNAAAKLADSAVAPLVALARGYERVHDREGAKRLASRATAYAGNTVGLTRQLGQLVAEDEDDILVMPWFSLSEVVERGLRSRSTNTQYRPSRPARDANGKVTKYAWFKGEHMVIDLHPATPPEWVDSSRDIMIAEGLIKGDSALTALLLDAGIGIEALSATPEPAAAREALNELMRTVPAARRVPVVNTASVTTWAEQQAQWRHISFKERRVIIAFDGDLKVNRMVWNQTRRAMDFVQERKGQPAILSMFDLSVEHAALEAGFPPGEKLGVDDYLSKIGSWSDLLRLLTDRLPDAPAAPERAHLGQWRVHPTNDAIVQEYAIEKNPDGSSQEARWHTRYHLGGRIVSTIARRRATPEELRSGVLNTSQAAALEDSGVEIEVALLDPDLDADQQPEYYRIIGPALMLSVNPRDWFKHAHELPNEVLNHPDWPPRKGEDWLSAIKAHRRDETETVIAWKTMGWVPVAGSIPAFIIGSQVIGRTERDEAVTRCSVTEHELPGASDFGLQDTFRDLSIEEYKAQVRSDIARVLQVFIENGYWKNRASAVAIVAGMLRPTIPRPPKIILFFVGPKGAGKSHSMSFLLCGWQAAPGTFTASRLTGSANDTGASLEHAVAHAVIWGVDDLAPQSDRRKAEVQEGTISQLIRDVANNSARRRMDGKTMTQREQVLPIAMLAITGENLPTGPSIQDRLIPIATPTGAFSDADDSFAERELFAETRTRAGGAATRLNAAMIRFWQQDDTGLGATWAERMETLEQMELDEREAAEEVLQEYHNISIGESRRRTLQIASLGLSFSVLYELAMWAGMSPDDPVLSHFGTDEGSYMHDLYELAALNVAKSRSLSPGRALVSSLGRLMASGRAHLANPTTPGAPPVIARTDDPGGTEVAMLNQKLGWSYDPSRSTWVPGGIKIGYFGVRGSEQICLFDTTNAFNEAKKGYPDAIPHGQTSTVSWESVWGEGLTSDATAKRKESVSARMMLAEDGAEGTVRLSGVPVLLQSLLSLTEDA